MNDTISLSCLVEGDTPEDFTLTINPKPNSTIGELKKLIYDERKEVLGASAASLKLWKVDIPFGMENIVSFQTDQNNTRQPTWANQDGTAPMKVDARMSVANYWTAQPTPECYHIICERPCGADPPVMNAFETVPNTMQLVSILGVPFNSIPSTTGLQSILTAAPAIPIPIFAGLKPTDAIILQTYVKPTTHCGPSSELSTAVSVIIDMDPPGGSKKKCILLWDMIIRRTLEIFSEYCNITLSIDRNTINPSTETFPTKRPDFLCWLMGVLVLKGEEKSSDSELNFAENELRAKATDWRTNHFGALKYIFTYAAVGQLIRFYTLDKSSNLTIVSPIYNLKNVPDRIYVINIVINIFRCFTEMMKQLPTTPVPLYTLIKRTNSEIIFFGDFVRKKIRGFGNTYTYANFAELKDIYRLTKDNKSIIHCKKPPSLSGSTYVVDLEPIGSRIYPSDLSALKSAIYGVLRGLDALHRVKYVHRDVRWDNVVRLDNGDWVLIDLEHAGKSGRVSYKLAHWPNSVLAVPGVPDSYQYTYIHDLLLVANLMSYSGLTMDHGATAFIDEIRAQGRRMTAATLLKNKWFNN